jgi:hypothetical protein
MLAPEDTGSFMNQNRLDVQINEVVERLESLGQPRLSSAARQRIWQQAYGRANLSLAKTKPASKARFTLPFLRVLASSVVALSLALTGMMYASAQSLPGDILYPLARGLEAGQLALAPASQRAALELQFINRRALEVQELVRRQRPIPAEMIAEISAAVDQMVKAPEFYGGAVLVEAHLALQEETLRLVVAQHPESLAATVAFQTVTAARLSLQPSLKPMPTPTAILLPPSSPTPGSGSDEDPPPGQGDTPPGQGDPPNPPPGQGDTPPGQGDPPNPPPGQGDTPPGQGDPPNPPPGQGDTPPGQGNPPNPPPGQGDPPPGQGDPPPGQGDPPPGQGDPPNPPPGQGDPPPGQDDPPPGQGKKP